MTLRHLTLYAGAAILLTLTTLTLRQLPGNFLGEPSETERGLRLEADRALLLRSIAVADGIRNDLLAGKRTLREAVAALRAEDLRRPPHLRIDVARWPPRTEEEYFARHAILRISTALQEDSRREEILARLEEEWQRYRAAASPSPLPSLPKSACPGGEVSGLDDPDGTAQPGWG